MVLSTSNPQTLMATPLTTLNELLTKADKILEDKKSTHAIDLEKVYFADVLHKKGLSEWDIAQLIGVSRQSVRRFLGKNKGENQARHLARLEKARAIYGNQLPNV